MQSAIVVGPEGEEVHCDQMGRVKIRFPGTRAVDHEKAGGSGAANDDGDSAWVARQWELALRGKLSLRATVRLPDGSERSFDLEPTGIAAGRVRGRDKAADIERTLPVSSITALEPLE